MMFQRLNVSDRQVPTVGIVSQVGADYESGRSKLAVSSDLTRRGAEYISMLFVVVSFVHYGIYIYHNAQTNDN